MRLELEMIQLANLDHINEFTSSKGAAIYQIILEAFPGFWVYTYFVQFDDYHVLIETGSGYGDSNKHLESGFWIISGIAEKKTRLKDLTHFFITHGHINHFDGLPYVMEKSDGVVGIP